MDPVIDDEIQNLIDGSIGDIGRLEFIQKSFREERKIYNSDLKYLSQLLSEHSKDKNILDRLHYLHPTKKSKKEIHSNYKNQKFCAPCEKMVSPKRYFNKGVLAVLLLLGIIPGVIYYGVKKKRCPVCKHRRWGVSPKK